MIPMYLSFSFGGDQTIDIDQLNTDTYTHKPYKQTGNQKQTEKFTVAILRRFRMPDSTYSIDQNHPHKGFSLHLLKLHLLN